MKIIFPGAAGVIALTALLGFVDGQRKYAGDNISNRSIILISDVTGTDQRIDSILLRHKIDSDNPVYLVKIKRGEALSEVLIDAETGRVLT